MTSFDYSDYVQFGIKSKAGRYALVGWYMFILLSSLLGDTTILVASIKYKAFKLQRCVVTIIQHIAVCDLLLVVSYILPCIVSLIANSWILGPAMCYVNLYVSYYAITVCPFLIATMTTSKILLVKYPLRAGFWLKRNIQRVCTSVCILSLFGTLAFLFIDRGDVSFDFRTYNCMYGFSSGTWKSFQPVCALLLGITPNATIIVTTIMLLVKAKQIVKGNLRWQGIITVLLTASVYCFSFILFTVYHIIEPIMKENLPERDPFHTYFFRVAWIFLSFNIIANFFIYSLAVDSFKGFLMSKLRMITPDFSKIRLSQGICSCFSYFHRY